MEIDRKFQITFKHDLFSWKVIGSNFRKFY